MQRLSRVLAKGNDDSFWFMCPGCESPVRIKGWLWNGNAEQPTFSPSILTTMHGHRCHSFIRDGKIEFLNDCTHELKGQTVDLPELPDWLIAED